WVKPNKGRIYKIFDPEQAKDAHVLSVKQLLAQGMARRTPKELVQLLDHPDQRIRQEAQFALAEIGSAAIPILADLAHDGRSQLARLHALWALGQVGRKNQEAYKGVTAELNDPDAEVRAQAAKVLGESRSPATAERLMPLLADEEPRVRFFAALSL